MSGIESLTGLLRLAELSGGTIETRIRIQKEAFLIATVNGEGFDSRDFTYHHYGPYNRGVSDLLQVAVSAGLLDESNEGGGDQNYTRYSYKLTDKGKSFLSNRPDPSDIFRTVVDLCRTKHWRALELAATVRYLEQRGRMDRETALNEALELKPATRDFLHQARQLLEALPA